MISAPCWRLPFSALQFTTMTEEPLADQLYSIDAVMYDSKKKKNPNMRVDAKDLEEEVKGKKVALALVRDK